MSVAGRVESLWRYPVKSMHGEEVAEMFAGFAGVYGDRAYAFRSSAAPKGFPYYTGREHQAMVGYRVAYRQIDRMAMPPNLAEAEALGPGLTLAYADPADQIVEVTTPSGEVLSIDDPRLIALLGQGGRDGRTLTLLRSDRALTDCRPVSLISIETIRQLSDEVGTELDKRRFRANIYIDAGRGPGFGEDAWVGRTLRIGAKAVVSVMDRDPRCKMITLDPDTGHATPEVMRVVARDHDGTAGVYAAVLVEGVIRAGDAIALVD